MSLANTSKFDPAEILCPSSNEQFISCNKQPKNFTKSLSEKKIYFLLKIIVTNLYLGQNLYKEEERNLIMCETQFVGNQLANDVDSVSNPLIFLL